MSCGLVICYRCFGGALYFLNVGDLPFCTPLHSRKFESSFYIRIIAFFKSCFLINAYCGYAHFLSRLLNFYETLRSNNATSANDCLNEVIRNSLLFLVL